MKQDTDFLVIGTGIAGLIYALEVSKFGKVLLITKTEMFHSATSLAQGGIASVSDRSDSFDSHIKDTLQAGAGLCNTQIVDLCVHSAPLAIEQLIQHGVHFSKGSDSEKYHLTREGGHSHHRIYHFEDLTGKEISSRLIEAAKENENIEIREHLYAIDLITAKKIKKNIFPDECVGCYALDLKTNTIVTIRSKITFLATGGVGKVYQYTSNPDIATGDGIAMAYRSGVPIVNMEFIQFHPTCLYHPQAKSFLISEALRGEGGILRSQNGEAFMDTVHPLKSLAPRDIVARAIDEQMKKTASPHVYLDMTHLQKDFLLERFPAIYQKCFEVGIDMAKDMIPVVPAAHYMCGGIQIDHDGATPLARLYAGGECAHTGLHGANRLASNSLLESVVFATRSALHGSKILPAINQCDSVPAWDTGKAVSADEMILLTHNWDEIRKTMWDYVGIKRSDIRLERAKNRFHLIQSETQKYYWDFYITKELLELKNLITTAGIIIYSAIQRRESRGLHYNVDCPITDDTHWKKNTVVIKNPANGIQ